MNIQVFPGKDVRSIHIKEEDSVTVIITYKTTEKLEAYKVKDYFINMEVWFESDPDENDESILVLWQGVKND